MKIDSGKCVFFWGACKNASPSKGYANLHKGCLSQWQECSFVVDGVSYSSAEQFMMAEKARTFGDGETLANFLSMFAGLFEEEPQVVPEVHGLTPDGNLTLVDDIGPVTGEGQQFITLVSKAGNVFYLIIDRDEKGEETVHFLNLVDERDLFTLMEEDEQTAYQEQLAAEAAAKEAAEKAAQEASQGESEEDPDADKDKEKESSRKGNMLPLLLIPLILAGAGGGWFYLQTKKKKQAASTPDPDADYADDEDEEDYGAGDTGETEINVDSPDTGSDPYEDEILGDPDDELPDGEEL